MIKQLKEESLIFISVLRWFILAAIIGIIAGFGTTIFLKLLDWGNHLSLVWNYYYLLLPLAMFLCVIIINRFAPQAAGHGTEQVIEAVHINFGKIKPLVVPVKLFTTIITIITGGSVGKEGPSAQIGAGLASMFSDIFKLSDSDRKKLVICGISAGFAAIFGTPVAGAIFGVEVLFIGTIMYDVLLPSFISGLIAFQVTTLMGIKYLHNEVVFTPIVDHMFIVKVALAGVFFGLVCLMTIEVMDLGKKLSNKINVWMPFKGIIGGLIIAMVALVVSKDYLGLGIPVIKEALSGGQIVWYAFAVKIILTSITLNFGGSGGIATPLFFIGATSGAILARVFGLDISTFAAIGLVSVLSGSTNAPVAASIMALEMFGPEIGSFAAISCVISFIITGHRSVYPSQILAIKKSSYINVEIGKRIEKIELKYEFGNPANKFYIDSMMRKIVKFLLRFRFKKKSR